MSDIYRITEVIFDRSTPRVRYGTKHTAQAAARAVEQYNRLGREGMKWMRDNRPDLPNDWLPTLLTIERLVISDAVDVTAEFTS